MRKGQLLLALILIVLSSCASTSSRIYSDAEKKSALQYLADDMIKMAGGMGEIGKDAFVLELPEEYTVYSSYSPEYEQERDAYLDDVSSIMSPVFDELFSLVESSLPLVLSSELDSQIAKAEGLTDRIQSVTAIEAYGVILDRTKAYSSELDKALNASAVSFRSLKAAYDNLLPLGSPEELPEPSGLLPEVISFVTMNVFYTRLGEAERYFKSQIPEDADSPYAIFWEDTI